MEYRILINGCSDTYQDQAEELNAWCAASLSSEDHGKTIIIHDGSKDTHNLISQAPTAEVMLVRVRRYQPETVLELLEKLELHAEADLYLFHGDFAGNELSVRLASRKSGSVLTGVNRIEIAGDTLLCRKAAYSNHMHAVLEMKKKPWCISFAKGAADPLPVKRDRVSAEKIHEIEADAGTEAGKSWILSEECISEEKTQQLEHASFVIAAGRGAGNEEACSRIADAASCLKADFGVSRLAAMNGWAPMNRMIGISGAVVRADLSIVLGISGAAAFMAGINKSDCILAVNTDPKAPIAGLADAVVIEEAVPFIDALMEIIQEDAPGREENG